MNDKLPVREFDYNLIKVFDAAISAGNATRASHRLKITPAAVSMALQRLQNIYDEDLFIRTRHGLLPTKRAKQIHRTFVQAIDLIHSTLDDPQDQELPAINILGSEISEIFYISPLSEMAIFDRFRISHFRRFSCDPRNISEQFRTGEIDLMISTDLLQDEEVEHVMIDQHRHFMVVCSNKNPMSSLKQLSLFNFYSAKHAVYQTSINSLICSEEKSILNSTYEHRGTRKIAYRSDSVKSILKMVEKTMLMAILPEKISEYFSTHEHADIAQLQLPDELKFKPLPVYASWRKNSPKADHIREIVTMLQTVSLFRK